jgi:8-oxo-dGTP diphosphatase
MKHQKPILVTSAILRGEDDQILVAQRRDDSKIEPGKWEFPGGKVEFMEHPETCLAREIKEELNLEIEIDSFYTLVSHVYPLGDTYAHIVLLVYLCTLKGGELQILEVKDARWVAVDDLADLTFAAADIPVVKKLQEDALRESAPL